MTAGKATLLLECIECGSYSSLEVEAEVGLPEPGDDISTREVCDCGVHFYHVTGVVAERDGVLRAIQDEDSIAVVPSDGDNYVLKVFNSVEILGRSEIQTVVEEIGDEVAVPTEASTDD